jgi:hypothetical protein
VVKEAVEVARRVNLSDAEILPNPDRISGQPFAGFPQYGLPVGEIPAKGPTAKFLIRKG